MRDSSLSFTEGLATILTGTLTDEQAETPYATVRPYVRRIMTVMDSLVPSWQSDRLGEDLGPPTITPLSDDAASSPLDMTKTLFQNMLSLLKSIMGGRALTSEQTKSLSSAMERSLRSIARSPTENETEKLNAIRTMVQQARGGNSPLTLDHVLSLSEYAIEYLKLHFRISRRRVDAVTGSDFNRRIRATSNTLPTPLGSVAEAWASRNWNILQYRILKQLLSELRNGELSAFTASVFVREVDELKTYLYDVAPPQTVADAYQVVDLLTQRVDTLPSLNDGRRSAIVGALGRAVRRVLILQELEREFDVAASLRSGDRLNWVTMYTEQFFREQELQVPYQMAQTPNAIDFEQALNILLEQIRMKMEAGDASLDELYKKLDNGLLDRVSEEVRKSTLVQTFGMQFPAAFAVLTQGASRLRLQLLNATNRATFDLMVSKINRLSHLDFVLATFNKYLDGVATDLEKILQAAIESNQRPLLRKQMSSLLDRGVAILKSAGIVTNVQESFQPLNLLHLNFAVSQTIPQTTLLWMQFTSSVRRVSTDATVAPSRFLRVFIIRFATELTELVRTYRLLNMVS